MSHSTPNPSPQAALIPAAYSGSCVMAIRHDGTNAHTAAALTLASALQGMGAELLRMDASNRADLHAPGVELARITHIVYNKSYSADEMAASLGPAVAQAQGAAFGAGLDLQALFDLGPQLWSLCDHDACLGRSSAAAASSEDALTLRQFVDMAQLSENTLARYTQFVNDGTNAAPATSAAKSAPATVPTSWACPSCTFIASGQRCEMCNTARPAAAAQPLPPPPAQPPAIPSPPVSRASTSAPASAASAAGPAFTVASWNILSADYSHPSTFFYCEPADLSFSAREPRILSSLAEATTVPAVTRPGSDIECLQEVDFDAVSRGMFDGGSGCGFGSVFVRRPNQKRDGCLIRWSDDVFELMPLPQLLAWQPHHPTKQQQAAQQLKRDTTHVRVHCPSNPQANMDRLGERKQKEKKPAASAALAASTANGAPSNKNAIASPSPSSSSDEAADAASAVLAVRQSLVLDRAAALSARMDALRARLADLKAAGSHAHSSLLPPSLSPLSRSISQERAEGAPKVKTQLRRDPSIETIHADAPHYFHALHFNDLSLLTRSKHNCHSSLFARYKKENVGCIVLLRHRASGRLVLVLNLHAFWNPEFADVKIGQCMLALQTLEEMKRQVASMYPAAGTAGTADTAAAEPAAIICGDFNSTPDSDVYRLLTTGEVPLPAINAATQLPLHSASTDPVPIVSSPFHDIVFAGGEELVDSQKIAASSSSSSSSMARPLQSGPDVLGLGSSSSPNVRIKLLLDSTLLRITKWLRAIGVDTVCLSSNAVAQPNGTSWVPPAPAAGAESDPVENFFNLARSENRRVVTQNKSLLRRRGMPAGAYAVPPTSKDPLLIFQDLCVHFGFVWDAVAFYSRCTTCNALVYPLSHAQYSVLPFLPPAYAIGVDDDGEPLRITRCVGPTCGRVRWWSSTRQLKTRQKLFQVRLDLDVSDLDDDAADDAVAQVTAALAGAAMPSRATVAAAVGLDKAGAASAGGSKGWQIAGLENLDEMTKNAIDQMIKNEARAAAAAAAGKKAAATKPTGGHKADAGDAASSSSAATAAPAVSGPPAVLPSDAEIAAARAARKASKAQNKIARAQQSADRKSLNKSKVHFEKTAAEAVLHGDDGEYLFDTKPAAIAREDTAAGASAALPSMLEDLKARSEHRLHSQQRAINAATLAAAASVGGVGFTDSDGVISRINGPQPPASKSIPRELYGQVADSMDQAVQELWWTSEKKAHMISVERRIAAETRRVLRARREQKRKEAEDMMSNGAGSGENADSSAAPADEMDDALPSGNPASASSAAAAASSAAPVNAFASRLHSYWQSVTDRHVPRQSYAGRAPAVHAHSLRLESAYPAATGCEPQCTNVTPRFLDCIDYILASADTLCVQAVRPQPTKEQLLCDQVIGYPSPQWPSDHCLLQATYRFR